MPDRARRLYLFLAVLCGLGLVAYFPIAAGVRAARRSTIQEAVARQDFVTALRRLDDYLARYPDDADARLTAAQTARRADDLAAAGRHLKTYRDLDGDLVQAKREEQLARLQGGDLTGAADVLRFSRNHPDDPAVPLMSEALARGYLAAGKPREAVQAADDWLSRLTGPADRGRALFLRAQGLERQGLIPDAINAYQESLAADPASPACRLALADVYVRELPEAAKPMLEDLRAAGYRPAAVELSLAACHRQLGELDRAAELLAARAAQEPDAPAVLLERSKLALDQRRPAEAEPLLRRAVSLQPRHRDANVQLARCLQELGRDVEAGDQIAKVQRLDGELLPAEKSP